MAKNNSSFPNQIRFNWGFWNAQADVEKGRENKWAGKAHFDPAYKAGYLAGYAEASQGNFPKTSEDAWFNALAWGDATA